MIPLPGVSFVTHPPLTDDARDHYTSGIITIYHMLGSRETQFISDAWDV